MGCCCTKAAESEVYEIAASDPPVSYTKAPPKAPPQTPHDVPGPIFENRECVICLDESSTKGWEWTPCSHGFHSECLRGWFRIRKTCPVCQRRVGGPPAPSKCVAAEVYV